ncbi:unnamed protein product [Spirodela intermedia]|uniref:Uncharacterized protein n=1 Tax=Spirodela intermedia TaxID=51605 RepID=A0A7I8KBJ3_SPIIN|nr:unnamed protein product [Spirodela intermedia]
MESPLDDRDYVDVKNNGRISSFNDCEDNTVDAESLSGLNHDVETESDLDVVGCPDVSGRATGEVLGDDTDTAECSSSFGETSDSDERHERDASDAEVDSTFYGENSDSIPVNRVSRVCRRKKLTPHWQKYIRSLRWRCNWLELRMNEIRSHNIKRKQRLSTAEKEKSSHLDAIASAKSAARAVSLSCDRSFYTMKRRRRKKNEERADLSAYMACHTVFSFYEKGVEADGLSVDDGLLDNGLADPNAKGHDSLSVDHDWPAMDFTEGDNSLELLLLEIETIQARVLKLRAQLNLVVDRKAGRVAAINAATQRDLVSTPGHSPSASPGCNGDALPIEPPVSPPNYLSECETEDLVMSEGAVSSFGDATPNIIESTVCLLSANPNQVGDAREDIVDEILISNRVAKEELEDFEKVGRRRTADGVREEGSVGPSSETGSETERTVSGEPKLRRCSETTVTYVRRSKRPRAERKLSPTSWHCEKIGRRRTIKSRDHHS